MELSCEEEWMSALPEELWDIPLTHLAIPGKYHSYLHVFPHITSFSRADHEIGSKKKQHNFCWINLCTHEQWQIIVLCKIKLFLVNAYSLHFCYF